MKFVVNDKTRISEKKPIMISLFFSECTTIKVLGYDQENQIGSQLVDALEQ